MDYPDKPGNDGGMGAGCRLGGRHDGEMGVVFGVRGDEFCGFFVV